MHDIKLLIILLSILWSVAYWLLGGIFFALVTLLNMGRVRKARFGCLFTIIAVVCGAGAAWSGVTHAKPVMRPCLNEAQTGTEIVSAVFGCGFGGVMGMFGIWAAALILCGFLLFYLSKPQKEPWIDFSDDSNADRAPNPGNGGFFD
jgi:hypothetical protein